MNFIFSPIAGGLSSLENSLVVLSILFLGMTLVEIGLDLVCNKPRNYRETAANLTIGVIQELINERLANGVAIAGLTLIAAFSPVHLPINLFTTVLAILVGDFLYYWNHRAEHRIRLFWAYHSVHHSSPDFNLTVALRLSWIENFILWIFYIPMAVMGFHPIQILIALEFIGLYQVWIHSQKIGRLGVLEGILNTASNHRVHHGANPQYIDKNYGGIFILWDRLFGTYQAETEKVIYGVTHPINTHNPIKINWLEYGRIWSDLRRSTSWKGVLQSLLGPPEAQPENGSAI